MKYVPTIGLEVHARLATRTKMFCDSLNDPDEKHSNTNVCPVCLGHPGALPTINKEAVRLGVRVGQALGGKVAERTKFDRKNYFYPDLPKGYQISQYDEPLITGGELCGVRITRIHLEEDAGTLIHEAGDSGIGAKSASLVDFNRAGTPLMELVTEPDLKSADDAVSFAKELRRILRYLGASNANLDKGEMRVEVNISLGQKKGGKFQYGTKVELKNLNSFRVVADGIEYEIERQSKILSEGKKVKQETRGWDENNNKTVSQRSKEEAQDYRYFPEPDLPPIITDIFEPERLKNELPELPTEKRQRFEREFGIAQSESELLTEEKAFADYFEASVTELAQQAPGADIGLLVNYLTSDLRGLMNQSDVGIESIRISPEHFAHLVAQVANNKITSRATKDLLTKMFHEGEDPETIIKRDNLEIVSAEDELSATVEEVIAENTKAVSDYKNGKESAIQFLVGTTMNKLRGRGDPKVLREMFVKRLSRSS